MKKSILALSLLSVLGSASAMAATNDFGNVSDIQDLINKHEMEVTGGDSKANHIFTKDGHLVATIRKDGAGEYTVFDENEGGKVEVTVDKDGTITTINGKRPEINDLPNPDKAEKDAIDNAINNIARNGDKIDEINNAANKAAKTVETEYARTTAKIEDNTKRIDGLEKNFSDMAARQDRMEDRMNKNEGKMSNGVAGVAAMANIPTVAGKFTVGAGMGHFNGSTAIAIGASNSFDNGISVKGSMAYAQGKFSQKDIVVGAGVGYSF